MTFTIRDQIQRQKLEALKHAGMNSCCLHEAMQTKASPNDFGVRVWWGFVIVGLLIGWMRTFDVWSVLLYGVAFWIAGMFFSVFALDSAEVQSRVAIFLHKLGERRVSNWLYQSVDDQVMSTPLRSGRDDRFL